MKLKRPLPADRTYEQILNHYLVEKELADRLRASQSHEERKAIFATMYDELFSRVPDHPRLTRREDPDVTRRVNEKKFRFVRKYIDEGSVFAEFAPGDCRFSFALSPRVAKVYGIDIANQVGDAESVPENFELVVYDGYSIGLPPESVDVAFSDQLLEHLHPDDVRLHLQSVHEILNRSGVYAFNTPHLFVGPTDVSMYFCDEPEGFHLKEWTYGEMIEMLRRVGFSGLHTYWAAKNLLFRLPRAYFTGCERALQNLRPGIRRKISRFLLPNLVIVAIK